MSDQEINNRIERMEKVKGLVKTGDLLTCNREGGQSVEIYFTCFDGAWLCGKNGNKKFDDISPLNVTHINKRPVEDL